MAGSFVDAEIARLRAASASAAGPRAATDTHVVQNFINGVAVSARGRKTFATVNPATGETLARVEIAGEAEVEAAVAAARAALPAWAALTGAQRGRVLRRVADLLRERNDDLARLETLDAGKPIQETSVVDVISGAECFECFAGLAVGL